MILYANKKTRDGLANWLLYFSYLVKCSPSPHITNNRQRFIDNREYLLNMISTYASPLSANLILWAAYEEVIGTVTQETFEYIDGKSVTHSRPVELKLPTEFSFMLCEAETDNYDEYVNPFKSYRKIYNGGLISHCRGKAFDANFQMHT